MQTGLGHRGCPGLLPCSIPAYLSPAWPQQPLSVRGCRLTCQPIIKSFLFSQVSARGQGWFSLALTHGSVFEQTPVARAASRASMGQAWPHDHWFQGRVCDVKCRKPKGGIWGYRGKPDCCHPGAVGSLPLLLPHTSAAPLALALAHLPCPPSCGPGPLETIRSCPGSALPVLRTVLSQDKE